MSTAAVVASTCCRECECYCGTLCSQCGYSCVAVDATACISKEEYEANVGSLPGTGSGAVISVGGAYYFFDGTTAACTGRINSNSVDWDISFLADACPETDVDPITVTIPFVGGWDFSQAFSITIDASGVSDYANCSAYCFDGGSDPELLGCTMDFTNVGTTGLQIYYDDGGGNCVGSATGGWSLCASSDYAVEKDTCAYDGTKPKYGNQIVLGTPSASPRTAVGEFTVTNTCGVDYTVDFSMDADGYMVICVDGTCCARFIGPAVHFVAFCNSVFAGSGLSFSLNDDGNWFIGAKVRSDFVGTAEQPTFPSSDISFTSGSTNALDSMVMGVDDYVYANLTGSFFMGGQQTFSCVVCSSNTVTGCGGYGEAAGELSAAMFSAGYVREMYGVSMAPAQWTWTSSGSIVGGAACALTGTDWSVT